MKIYTVGEGKISEVIEKFKEAQKIARQADLQCTIFDEKKLAKMKMNAILAVGSGSASKPRLTVLKSLGVIETRINDKNVLHWFVSPKGKQMLGDILSGQEDR